MAKPVSIAEAGQILYDKYYRGKNKMTDNNNKYYDYCTCDDPTFHEWDEGICPHCSELDEIDEQPDDSEYCDCIDDVCEDCYIVN